MARAISVLLVVVIASVAVWQFVRVTQYEKDVFFHHAESCKVVSPGKRIVDLSRFGDVNVALVASATSTQEPFVLTVHSLESGAPSFRALAVSDIPNFSLKPLGFHVRKNETMFVLSQAKEQAEVFVISLQGDDLDEIKGKYVGRFWLPKDLSGKVTDLIAAEDGEVYLAQTFVESGSDSVSRLKQLAYEFLDIKGTYVHHCTFSFGQEAKCRALNNTQEVSVTGISMDKFGSYYVAYASIDMNWIGVYERKSSGDFSLRQKVHLRDRCQKLDYDVFQQRGYCGAVPYPYQSASTPYPGGAIELTSWDNREYRTYRRLLMHDGTQFKGGSCVTRQGSYMLMTSVLEENVLVCQMTAPFI